MAVFRVHKTDNYTVMSNHHLRNEGLSLSAKGLLSVILSLPPDWKYSISGLAQISKEGERAIRSVIKELRESGYIVVSRVNPEPGNGRIRYIYDVYEIPRTVPEDEESVPETAKPQFGQVYPAEGVQREGVVPEGALGESVLTGRQLNTDEVSTDELSTYLSSTDSGISAKPRKTKPFTPPTIEDVQSYINEKGYHFSAREFFDYYSVSNWHFASGKPVKNWKQCCVTWESHVPEDKKRGGQRDYSAYDRIFNA